MRKKYFVKILSCSILLLLTGCGERVNDEGNFIGGTEPVSDERADTVSVSLEAGREEEDCSVEVEREENDCSTEAEEVQDNKIIDEAAMDSEELLDAFLAGEVPAIYDNEKVIMFDEFPFDDEDYYSVGERLDLDNDGENEQIVNGPYGGIYLDARDGKVYVLAEGEGTTGLLSYTYYDNAVWIVHSDILHAGRKMHWLTKYDGDGNIADEFLLSAEYWDSPYDGYDESSIFTYRDEEISMTEYEALSMEIFGD